MGGKEEHWGQKCSQNPYTVVIQPSKTPQEHALSGFKDEGPRVEWLLWEGEPQFIGGQQVDQLQTGVKWSDIHTMKQ